MDYLSSLNQSQYKACVSDATYLRIIAGAGTGKTQTLSNRIAYFILEKNMGQNIVKTKKQIKKDSKLFIWIK